MIISSILAVFRRAGTWVRTRQARSIAVIGSSRFLWEATIYSRRERDAIRIGDSGVVRGELLVIPHGGSIRIGDWVYVGPGSKIWSSSEGGITIGNRVLISHNVNIHDTDAHPIDAKQRFDQTKVILTTGHPVQIEGIIARPVVIGDDAWIGFNASILKGVTIGEGAVIGACSVVTRDVLPYSVVVGNPARTIKTNTR